ncbi:MAG: HAMP domain-containing protein [Candidatus Aminicenantes bacterium]|nr:HAMP domain-containing protein [Candidatus Aminicenantes bacterium]
MKLKVPLSLSQKLIIAVVSLLFFMGTSILFLIEQREVNAILDEQKSKGELIAKYLIQLNLQDFMVARNTDVKENIEKQIDDKLVYAVFYDREGYIFAANDFIADNPAFLGNSNLNQNLEDREIFFSEKRIKDLIPGNSFPILEIESPIFVEGSARRWGSLKIGLSLEDMYAEINQTRLKLLLIGLGAILLGIIGAVFLAKRITGPVKNLVEGTIKISRGDFYHKINIPSKDEIGDLAKSFNEMSKQLLISKKKVELANKKLIQAEKLASIGRISATIAHEIRNPLTSVKLNIQKLSESDNLNKLEKGHLGISQEGITQIENFIKEMLNFTRVSELNLNPFPMEQIVESSIKMISDSLELKNITLEKDIKKNLPPVMVDGDKIRQVILNIFRNACEAVGKNGKIRISIDRISKDSGNKVKIEISNNGIGIPKSDWENIFEPFFTTKSSGFGLGLANARKIIEQHNGTIKVKGKGDRSSCFEIILPCQGEK